MPQMAPPLITIAEARERVLEAARALGTERDRDRRRPRPGARRATSRPPATCRRSPARRWTATRSAPVPPAGTLTVVGESRAGTPSTVTLADGRRSGSRPAPRSRPAPTRSSARRTSRRTSEQIETHGRRRRRRERARRRRGHAPGATVLARRHAARRGRARRGRRRRRRRRSSVARRPRVPVLCTGDELRAPGEPLGPGEIHNSNAPMLVALATALGAVARARAPASRRPGGHRGRPRAPRSSAPTSWSSPAASRSGPHDHVKPALAALGVEEVFWRVALQPGKPTWFGAPRERARVRAARQPGVGRRHVLAVRPSGAGGAAGRDRRSAAEPEAVLGGRRAAQPAPRAGDPRPPRAPQRRPLVAIPNGPQGSHIVTSLLGADALAMIPAGDGRARGGHGVVLAWSRSMRRPQLGRIAAVIQARDRRSSPLARCVAIALRRRRRRRLPARAVIVSPRKSTVIARDGAVRSVQSAELTHRAEADLERLWNPTNLENLARTYWRFLSRVTLGLIRVVYGENERSVVLLGRPLTLLRFEAPEYDARARPRQASAGGSATACSSRGAAAAAATCRSTSQPPWAPGRRDGRSSGSRSRSRTSTRRSPRASACPSTRPRSPRSTCSSRTRFLRSLATLDLARVEGRAPGRRRAGRRASRTRRRRRRAPAPRPTSAGQP